jgi:hypothetical protein
MICTADACKRAARRRSSADSDAAYTDTFDYTAGSYDPPNSCDSSSSSSSSDSSSSSSSCD